MFHCNGWGMTVRGHRHGRRSTSCCARSTAPRSCGASTQHGVTLLCGAPAVVAAVLDAAAEWDGPIPGAARVRIVVAGAPPPTRTIERVETELGWEFIQIYGLTETSPLLTMNRGRAEYDDLAAGERAAQARPRRRARARRARCRSTTRARCWRASNVVLEGYWEQPEATADAIVDGWFHTGDGGTIDDEGYLTISDRKKDVIISRRRERVVDRGRGRALLAPRGRRGRRDRRARREVGRDGEGAGGARAGRARRPKPSSSSTAADALAHYKCPTSVEFRDELARTATGKLQKFKLRAPYWEGRTRTVN